MGFDLLSWFGGVVASVSITGIIGYLWRDSLGRFMTKSVEHRFDKKLEKYKSEIKENERELEQMRGYLSSVRSGRDSLIQIKSFESAETLIKARSYLNEFHLAVTYMQMFKVNELFENIDNPNIQNAIDALIKPLKLDDKVAEYKKIDVDTPRLYLSDKTMKVFDIYSGIVMVSVATLRMLELKDKDASSIVSAKNTVNNILDLLPSSKKGFEEYGDSFIFQFHDHFRRELLAEIKNEITGESNMARDTELAAELALGLRNAKVKVKEAIERYDIPNDLFNNETKIR
ncbi:hypothetical protein [Klebsiella aerogenes]|uniref:hypothetical protein n=1 Tax=Klebsiella aerogenes TaxID=548 RepID=UPI0025A37F39|nr:hypothetical protein [Klebsiella aerogenes]MDM8056567.1 hypothetical protein [Klebsiella aerogenes]MDM8080633.1 hypothetical protein [Klebsiella aerogenes]